MHKIANGSHKYCDSHCGSTWNEYSEAATSYYIETYTTWYSLLLVLLRHPIRFALCWNVAARITWYLYCLVLSEHLTRQNVIAHTTRYPYCLVLLEYRARFTVSLINLPRMYATQNDLPPKLFRWYEKEIIQKYEMK